MKCSLILILLFLLNIGCAITYCDKTKDTCHLWGFGHLKSKIITDNNTFSASAIQIDTIGFSTNLGRERYGILLGYDSYTIIKLFKDEDDIYINFDNDLFDINLK